MTNIFCQIKSKLCDILDALNGGLTVGGDVNANVDLSSIETALQAICDKLELGVTVNVGNWPDFQAAFEAALNNANLDVTVTNDPLVVQVSNLADLGAIVQAAFTAALEAIEPLDVAVTNFADLEPFLESAFTAALEAVTLDVNITNDSIDVNITESIPLTVTVDGEVTVTPNADWAALLEAAVTAALNAADDINVTVDGGTITATLDPATIAAIQAAVEAALAAVEVEVTLNGEEVTVNGTVGLDQATLDALENITIDGGEIALDAATIQALVDALQDLNVVLDPQSIADLVAALEAATLTVTLDGETVTVDGTVDIGNIADLITALEAATLTVTGNVTVDALPDVVLDAQTIADLAAAISAALDGLTVNIGNTPIEVTGTIDVSGSTVTATIDNFQDLVDLLDGLNVTLDYAALQAAVQAALDAATDIDVTLDNVQFDALLDAIANSDVDDTDDDVRPVVKESSSCLLDVDGYVVPDSCIADVMLFGETGTFTSSLRLYIVDGVASATQPANTTIGECADKLDLSDYEIVPPCLTNGGGFGDCDCEITPQSFDPDVGRGRDSITANGDGTYNVFGGTTQGIMTMLLHPDSTHPAANCDLVLIHVMRDGASGSAPGNTGWLLIHPGQVVNVTGAGYALSSNITWDPRISVGTSCREADIAAAIVAEQGDVGQLGATQTAQLLASNQLVTNLAGPLDSSGTPFYLNGYAWDIAANAGTAPAFPGNDFGRCYTLVIDPDCQSADDQKTIAVFDECAYEKQQQTPIRIDDGLCVLVEIEAQINYAVFGSGPWGIELDTPVMSSGNVVQYLANTDVVLGSGPHTINFPAGLPSVVNVVLSDGENTVTIAIDTSPTGQTFNTATSTKIGKQQVVREIYCDGSTKIVRCLNNQELTGVTPVKCDVQLMADPVYLVSKTCYVDKESPNTRTDFTGYVDDASEQIFPNAIGDPDCPITVLADGTGLTWQAAGTAMRLIVPPGESREVALSWPSEKCAVISGGPVVAGDTVQFESEADALASSRPDIAGSVAPDFTGSGTPTVVQTGIAGADRILVSSDGITKIVITYTNNGAANAQYFFGSFVGEGTPIYWCHEMYSNGTDKIFNAATGAEVEVVGEWQQTDCADVPAQQTCCERTNELLEELLYGDCLECSTYNGCIFRVRGFDYQDHATWVAGDGMSWNVNGTQVDIDVATLSAALPKSAWYAPIWDALPAGWTVSVTQDSAADNSGADDKVTFEFGWSGEVCEAQTVVIERLTGTNDTLTMSVNPDGTYSASWLDDGGNPIDSNDSILLCDGTPAPDSPVTGTLGGGTDPIGDPALCAARKLGADFVSNAAGSGTHMAGSLYDTNGPIIGWVGSFVVTDSAGTDHAFADAATVTGMASGSTQQVLYTGMIHWTDGADEYRCDVVDKAISAAFTVQ